MARTNRNRTLTLAALMIATVLPITSARAADVGYFRFEEGADGAGATGAMISGVDSVVDTAGGDDPFRTFDAFTAPTYTALVPNAYVPQTGAVNDLSTSYDGGDDLFQSVVGPLRTGAYTDFTVEAYVNFAALGGFQTVVGRDDIFFNALGNNGIAQSLFYLQKNNLDDFRVELTTASNTQIAVNSTFSPVVSTWYHLAAVGNASAGTLSLYVNGALAGSTGGYTGLFNPPNDSSWTIGRGEFNGAPVDFVNGRIDEVRFSDTALLPSQFLNAGTPIPVVNGSFEDPVVAGGGPLDFPGWFQGTDTGVIDDITAANGVGPGGPPVAADGDQMAFIGNGTAFSNIWQDISHPLIGDPNAVAYTFTIGLAIRTVETPGTNGTINIGIHDLTGVQTLLTTAVGRALLTNEFQYFSVTIPADTVLPGDILRIFVDKLDGNSLIVADHARLEVTVVPTPAALPAGLALVGLTLIRRRRR